MKGESTMTVMLRAAWVAAVVAFGAAGCGRHGGTPEAPHTTAAEREKFARELIDGKIEGVLRGILQDSTEGAWEGAFWGMGLARHTSVVTDAAMARGLEDFSRRSPAFRRSLLEAVYTLYPGRFGEEMIRIAGSTDDPKLFAMAALHLARSAEGASHALLREQLETRFPGWQEHPILASLHFDLTARGLVLSAGTPPLVDLLAYRFGEPQGVLFSFQRPNRDDLGLAVVRGPGGRFVRNPDGSYFAIPHFARAASNLPGYLTNGNTPQGVHSIQGYARVANPFIGPTETVQMVMPHEAGPAAFFHGAVAESVWTEPLYARLLPPSWRGWFPMWESERAGRAGRTEIIAHGTTIDPAFSKGMPFEPFTPSQGCLTAHEEWSAEGVNTRSDQRALLQAMRGAGIERGWCVVVELPGVHGPVTPGEVKEAMDAAEGKPPGGDTKR